MKLALAALVMVGVICVEPPSSYVPPPKPPVAPAPDFSPPPGLTRLRLGVTPYLPSQELAAANAPLIEYLSRRLKVRVELVIGENFDDVGVRLERGEIDVAELSGYAYVRAQKRFKLRPLVTVIADGSDTAAGYILVRQDSSRQSLDDLKGGSFGFVDPASAAGYLLPYKMLVDHGIDPSTQLSRTEFFGDHQAVLLALQAGKVDAAATFEGALAALKRARGIDPLSFRIIAKTPRTPRDVFCVRSDFTPEVGAALTRAFTDLSTKDGVGRQILDPLNINGFVPTNDRLYDGLRAAAAQLEARDGR